MSRAGGDPGAPLDGRVPGRLANLPRRVYLTWRYRGPRALVYQALVFPLRLTPLDRLLGLGPGAGRATATARRWYRRQGRPVTIVIPSYRDAGHVRSLVAAIRRTTSADRVRVIVVDDASGPGHVAALGAIDGITVIEGEANLGFAGNANRGLRAADRAHDVVLLNSDVVPLRDWLACLQFATEQAPQAGVIAARLLYPDNRIQYAGTIRNPQAPEWFDHRFRFKPADWGPANVAGPTLAATGAAMYITREAIERVGLFDEDFPMAFEDVDYGLRTWQAGLEVRYAPTARLHHRESATRGTAQGERELRSQSVFWQRWGTMLDERRTTTDDGRLRIVYVTADTSLGGGHRVVFEQLNGLARRGHDVSLWTLSGPPDWYELHCPVRTFADYDELALALEPLDAIKVATWWQTATPVWRASVIHGVPVYLVQDIETSYYADAPGARQEVLATYRPEFRYLTTSEWNREHLQTLGLTARVIAPAVDHATFHPLDEVRRRDDMVLAVGRTNPLKNVALTVEAWRSLPRPRPELCLFGFEPEIADEPGIRYVTAPSDAEVNRLMCEATVFVQTSRHEGYCLPILEAMASATAVVCTDAHGNRDFCSDGENCLMPRPRHDSVADALSRVLRDAPLRAALGKAGRRTASGSRWERHVDALERYYREMSTGPPRPSARSA